MCCAHRPGRGECETRVCSGHDTSALRPQVLCRWILSVKKNYRKNVAYHNWRHAFNTAQCMFAALKAGKIQVPVPRRSRRAKTLGDFGGKIYSTFLHVCFIKKLRHW